METGVKFPIQRYEILGTPSEAAFDKLAILAREICGAKAAFIGFQDDDRLALKARVGIEASELPADLFAANQSNHEDESTLYLSVPLHTAEGETIGTIGVLYASELNAVETDPRLELKAQAASKLAWLQQVGRIVEQTLEARRALVQARHVATLAQADFFANVSYDMRTPLNGIIGLTEIIRDTKLSREQTEFVDAIQHSGENLLSLVGDILDLTRTGAKTVAHRFRQS